MPKSEKHAKITPRLRKGEEFLVWILQKVIACNNTFLG